MGTRVLVVDQAEARLHDLQLYDVPMPLVLRLNSKDARVQDRDLKSDRPGRVFDRAPSERGRRGAVPHHATGSERGPRKLAAVRFAGEIAKELDRGLSKRESDRLAIVAGQPFRGILMAALNKRVTAVVSVVVAKDLIHQSESKVREHLVRKARAGTAERKVSGT